MDAGYTGALLRTSRTKATDSENEEIEPAKDENTSGIWQDREDTSDSFEAGSSSEDSDPSGFTGDEEAVEETRASDFEKVQIYDDWYCGNGDEFLLPQVEERPEGETVYMGKTGKWIDGMFHENYLPEVPAHPLSFLESLSRKSLIIVLQAAMAELEDCCFEYINRYPDIPHFHPSQGVPGAKALQEVSNYIGSNTNFFPGDSFNIPKRKVEKILGPYGNIDEFRHGLVHRYEKFPGIGHIRSAFDIPSILKDEDRAALFKEVLAVIKESVSLGCVDVPQHPVVTKFVSRRQRLLTTLDLARELGRRLEEACFKYAVRQNFDTSRGGNEPEGYDLGFWCNGWSSSDPDGRPSFNPQNEVFPDLDGTLFESMMRGVRDIRNMAAHGTAYNEALVIWDTGPGSKIRNDPTIAAAIRFVLLLDCPSEAVQMEVAIQQFVHGISREAALKTLHSELFAYENMKELEPMDLLSRWKKTSVLQSDLFAVHHLDSRSFRSVEEAKPCMSRSVSDQQHRVDDSRGSTVPKQVYLEESGDSMDCGKAGQWTNQDYSGNILLENHRGHKNFEDPNRTLSIAFSSSNAAVLPQLDDRHSHYSLRSRWTILDVLLKGYEEQSNKLTSSPPLLS